MDIPNFRQEINEQNDKNLLFANQCCGTHPMSGALEVLTLEGRIAWVNLMCYYMYRKGV
jgi:hypothetical protein